MLQFVSSTLTNLAGTVALGQILQESHASKTCAEDMFDKVLFLACGHLVYNGPPSGLRDWLTESGLWDPDRALTTSITDMVLDCITAAGRIGGCNVIVRVPAACLRGARDLPYEESHVIAALWLPRPTAVLLRGGSQSGVRCTFSRCMQGIIVDLERLLHAGVLGLIV